MVISKKWLFIFTLGGLLTLVASSSDRRGLLWAGPVGPVAKAKRLSDREKDYRWHMKEGDRLFRAFQNREAMEHYEKAHELYPLDFSAHVKLLRTNNNLGQILRDTGGDSDEVRPFFRRNVDIAESLFENHPDKVESPFSVAIAYGNLALYSSTSDKVRLSANIEVLLKRAIEIDPEFPYSYLGLGVFYCEVSKISFIERFFARLFFGKIPYASFEEAEQNFKLALEKDPNFVFTHYRYAKCLEETEHEKEAIDEYRKLISMPETDSNDAALKRLSFAALERLGIKGVEAP